MLHRDLTLVKFQQESFSFYKYRTDKRALGISIMDSWLMINESLQMSPNSHCSAVVTYKFTLTAWGFVYEKKMHIWNGDGIFVIAK